MEKPTTGDRNVAKRLCRRSAPDVRSRRQDTQRLEGLLAYCEGGLWLDRTCRATVLKFFEAG